MIKVNGIPVNVTIFPDKTSQVWQLSEALIDSVKEKGANITWLYESEVEFLHLTQLQFLLRAIIGDFVVTLECPYMPWARQDKELSNDSCFALAMYLHILGHIQKLTTFDVHNPKAFQGYDFDFENIMPYDEIEQVIKDNEIDLIVYPDKGAAGRYKLDFPSIALSKVRDQSTGEITGLAMDKGDEELVNELKPRILVVDDICDGGRTFIEAAKLMTGCELYLFVSHGIFSKGLDILFEAGYNSVYSVNNLPEKTFLTLTEKKNVLHAKGC